ncbi:hypothetical protein CCGE531_14890 [Rhizobium sp. CCGE531]|nr:hypothetical protein CCGE531_14890 [Rhizobium sp. CCGE531]AYG73530.1 hypothetical protein CCGE532_14305 [Rhizobium sp. CCGE532]
MKWSLTRKWRYPLSHFFNEVSMALEHGAEKCQRFSDGIMLHLFVPDARSDPNYVVFAQQRIISFFLPRRNLLRACNISFIRYVYFR